MVLTRLTFLVCSAAALLNELPTASASDSVIPVALSKPTIETEQPQDGPSNTTATVLALTGAAAGAGLLGAGLAAESGELALGGLATLTVSPSLGHFYAGEGTRGLLHTGIRAGGATLTIVGAAMFYGGLGRIDCEGDDCDGADPGIGALVMISGSAIVIADTLYTIYDAPRAAERSRKKRSLLVSPTSLLGPGQSHGVGLAFVGTF